MKELLFVIFLVSTCSGLLEEYFNLSSTTYNPYQNESIRWLERCLPTLNVTRWESSVRKKNVTEDTCSQVAKVKMCKFEGYQNATVEYLKLLVHDAEEMCNKKELTIKMGIMEHHMDWEYMKMLMFDANSVCRKFGYITKTANTNWMDSLFSMLCAGIGVALLLVLFGFFLQIVIIGIKELLYKGKNKRCPCCKVELNIDSCLDTYH